MQWDGVTVSEQLKPTEVEKRDGRERKRETDLVVELERGDDVLVRLEQGARELLVLNELDVTNDLAPRELGLLERILNLEVFKNRLLLSVDVPERVDKVVGALRGRRNRHDDAGLLLERRRESGGRWLAGSANGGREGGGGQRMTTDFNAPWKD